MHSQTTPRTAWLATTPADQLHSSPLQHTTTLANQPVSSPLQYTTSANTQPLLLNRHHTPFSPFHISSHNLISSPQIHFLSASLSSTESEGKDELHNIAESEGGSWELQFHFWFCPRASKREERRRNREQTSYCILQDQPAAIQPPPPPAATATPQPEPTYLCVRTRAEREGQTAAPCRVSEHPVR